ncbi:MAG: alpha/beta fold hydrolase, partial [Actinomycetota bacterium]
MPIRDVSLFVEVVGRGHPLLLMHGGPSADHWTMLPFRRLADQFTVIFYDHRCNGRSTGAVESMTWENLTADADALRERLGFERWAVLGHSFGGHVALEYALRYPDRVSHLVLMDTAGDTRWSQQNAAAVLAERGYSSKKVELVRRWFNGEYAPWEWWPIFMRISSAYQYDTRFRALVRQLMSGEWHSKVRPEAAIFAFRHLLKGWTIKHRLGEIKMPALVIAGRQDFVFPPEAQHELAAGISGARLKLIDRAGHNPHEEQTDEVMKAVRGFMSANTVVAAGG